MLVRGRQTSVEGGNIRTVDRSGNSVLVSGTALGMRVRVERIEPVGNGLKVYANGTSMDITPSELDDFVSFVDNGSPDRIKLLRLSRVVTRPDGSQVVQIANETPWLGISAIVIGVGLIIYLIRNFR